jgi:hypothetical protein
VQDLKIKQISNGYFDYDFTEAGIEKTESFAQRLILTLNTWKAEFLYNTEEGIDYLSLFKSYHKSKAIESFFIFSLRENLLDFDFLTEFNLSWSIDKKTAYVCFVAHSKNGEKADIVKFEI